MVAQAETAFPLRQNSEPSHFIFKGFLRNAFLPASIFIVHDYSLLLKMCYRLLGVAVQI